MFFFHCVSDFAIPRFGKRAAHDGERLAVGRLAIAVPVAVLEAEAVEQRARPGGVVERLRRQRRIVAADARRQQLVGRQRIAGEQHADQLVDVEAHADRAAQRDLLRRVAADQPDRPC